MAIISRVRLECINYSTNTQKFYEIAVDKIDDRYIVSTGYGRIGNTPRSAKIVLETTNEWEACRKARDIRRSKIIKGYKEINSSGGRYPSLEVKKPKIDRFTRILEENN
jgi:predicted DNA-binding WGR domain protein